MDIKYLFIGRVNDEFVILANKNASLKQRLHIIYCLRCEWTSIYRPRSHFDGMRPYGWIEYVEFFVQ